MKTFFILPLALLCGCSNLPKVARELAKDPAAVSLKVTTIYGNISLVRLSPTTNTPAYTISPDGTVTVKP